MHRIALLLVLLTVVLPAATVARLDGQVLEGDEIAFTPDGEAVQLDGQRIPLSDCDWLARIPGDPPPPVGYGLLLADGSWLPAAGVVAGGADVVVAQTVLGELELALGTVIGWGDGNWVLAQDGAEDDLVLLGQERYRGTVLGLREGQLTIDVAELGEVQLPLARVTGLRLAEPIRAPAGLLLAVRLAEGRPPLKLRPGSRLTLVAAPELVVPLPAGRVEVHGGRRVWLSSLEPADVTETGAFGVTWPHRRDENFDGGPISLGGRRYERGLVVHSSAELAWDLGGGYRSLVATVGIEDLVGAEGDCRVRILVDGEERWVRERVRGGDQPEELRIGLEGAQRLTLQVEAGERFDIGDHLALAGAYLVRTPD